jgi:hypothetical protein
VGSTRDLGARHNATTKRWENIAPIFETKEWVYERKDVWT